MLRKKNTIILALIFCFTLFIDVFCADDPNFGAQADELYRKATELIDNYEGNTEQLREATIYLKTILDKNPNYALAYVGLARVEYKLAYINYDNYERRNLEYAQEYLTEALKLNPNLFEAYLARGYTYLFQKNLSKAKKMVDELNRIRPQNLDAQLLLAEIMKKEKKYDEALNLAKEVAEGANLKRLKMGAYGLLDEIYIIKKEYDLAEKSYLAQLELSPHSPWVKVNYSSFLIDRGNYDKAIEMAKGALEEMKFGMGRYTLARAYYKKAFDLCWNKKDYENAIRYFKLVLEQDPESPDTYYSLGVCYSQLSYQTKDVKLLDQAEAAFRKALEIDPHHSLSKKALKKHLDWVGKEKK
jgi:tetratricopeptide (TPR) repeat protein